MLFRGAAATSMQLQPDHSAVWVQAAMVCPATDRAERRLTLVPRSHYLRSSVEGCIRETYERTFGARHLVFPSTLLGLLDRDDVPLCAAGLRTADEGFFSEIYLDEPIEKVLSRRFATAVRRDAVFEVTTLASHSAETSSLFIRQIAALGSAAGFAWSFFTAVERLRKLLAQLGILTSELAAADPSRVAQRDHWGSYYAHSPKVCAVNDRWLDAAVARPVTGSPDA
jgi:hypothetical protein